MLRYLVCMQAGLLGVLGLAFGMVMETTLLIIRSNRWVWPWIWVCMAMRMSSADITFETCGTGSVLSI